MSGIEVISVSFPRTGTFTMHLALNELGYNSHHMREVFKRKDLADWAKIGDGDYSLLDKCLSGYNATTDAPSSHAWMIPAFGPRGNNFECRDDKKHCIESYNRHVEEVKRTVPKDQLLIFDHSEGWASLCKFLNKPIPSKPYPHANEQAEFTARFAQMKRLDKILTFGLGAVVAAGAGLAYYFTRVRR